MRVSGAVRGVRASRRDGLPMLRAELGGGADRITVIWLGRNRIAGIEPGRVLAVEGMLSEQDGRRVMYNPRYDLAADQAAGPAPRP